MQIIGITGISGAGKSTVSEKICALKNGKHINADVIAKNLSEKRRKILSRDSRKLWEKYNKRKLRNR